MEIQPKDPSRGHFYISLIKSGFRLIAASCIIAAGYAIGERGLIAGGALLFVAEVLGIFEELV